MPAKKKPPVATARPPRQPNTYNPCGCGHGCAMPHAHVSAQMDTKTALMGTLVANFTAEIIKIMEAGND